MLGVLKTVWFFGANLKRRSFPNLNVIILPYSYRLHLGIRVVIMKNVAGQPRLCTILIAARVCECLLIFTLFFLVMIHECLH